MAEIKLADTWHFSSTGELNRHDYLLPNDATHYYKRFGTRQRPDQVSSGNIVPNTPGFKHERLRQTPTWSSTLFHTDGFERYDVRKGTYQTGPAPERPAALPRKEIEPAPKHRPAKRMNCSPYEEAGPNPAQDKRYLDKFSHNADFYKRDGYNKYVPKKPAETGDIKISDPKCYYGPTPKHLPNPNKYETPNDFTVTLEANDVGKKVDASVLQRDLAKRGLNMMGSSFSHNPITNERTGKGIIHVRAKDAGELQKIEKVCTETGMKVQKSNNYKPTWNRH